MSAKAARVTSFTDELGATTSIPANSLSLFAQAKAEQAATVSRFVANYTAGCAIELTECDVSIFAGLAGDLAEASREATSALTEALDAATKGDQE
jgi:hypothetical protein